jgi:hypothetical protein
MANQFNEMQSKHLALISRYEVDKSSVELLNEVQEYIELVRITSKQIIDRQERKQLENILQFWATVIYDGTGKYPEIKLLPSTVLIDIKKVRIGAVTILFLLLISYYFYKLVILLNSDIPSAVLYAQQTIAAASFTPKVVYYPTPSLSTPDPRANIIVSKLNESLSLTIDPLSASLDARYQVVDVSFLNNNTNQPLITLAISVRCECVNNSNCCTPERTFIAIVDAMKATHEVIYTQVPTTVIQVQVSCFEHSRQIGTAIVGWSDLIEYFRGTTNGYQLGNRVMILSTP